MSTLPPNQCRVVQAYLGSLERELAEIEDILDGRQDDRIFTRFVDELGPDAAQAGRDWIRDMRVELRRGRKLLGLDETTESMLSVLEAHLSQIWVTLEESRSHRLEGYGPLTVEQAATVDGVITHLLDLLGHFRAHRLATHGRGS